MAANKTIIYHGTTIDVWDQSIRVGNSAVFYLRRPVTESDILVIKTIVDAGRDALRDQLRGLRKQKRNLLGER